MKPNETNKKQGNDIQNFVNTNFHQMEHLLNQIKNKKQLITTNPPSTQPLSYPPPHFLAQAHPKFIITNPPPNQPLLTHPSHSQAPPQTPALTKPEPQAIPQITPEIVLPPAQTTHNNIPLHVEHWLKSNNYTIKQNSNSVTKQSNLPENSVENYTEIQTGQNHENQDIQSVRPKIHTAAKLSSNSDSFSSHSYQPNTNKPVGHSPLKGIDHSHSTYNNRRRSRQASPEYPLHMSSRPQNRRRGPRQTSPDYEPPLSSSRPQSRHTSPKREYLNPQRYWERDNTVPYNNQNHQTQNYNLVNQPPRYHGGYTHHHSEGRAQKRDYREYQRPNHVSETSRRLTSVGADGTTVQVTSSSITHDGKEVYVKSSEEVRQDKLKELENEGINGNLEGPK